MTSHVGKQSNLLINNRISLFQAWQSSRHLARHLALHFGLAVAFLFTVVMSPALAGDRPQSFADLAQELN